MTPQDQEKPEAKPPAYTMISEQAANYSETQPLLGQQPVIRQPVIPQQQPILQQGMPTYQVVVASTGQPVPVRILDGYMLLTVVEPVQLFCPCCLQFVLTSVMKQNTCSAYYWSACMCVFMQPFCLVPFCIDNCKETVHSCSSCGTVLAKVMLPN